MARSNYDKWMEQCGKSVEGYVAPARGEPRKWVNRKGMTVEVLRAADEGLDGDGQPWLAVCTGHGCLVSCSTKAIAVDACRDTVSFCGECQGIAEAARRG